MSSLIRRALGPAPETRAATDLVESWPTSGPTGDGYWTDGMSWVDGPGFPVSPEGAMRLSAVFGCWRLVSESIATLPVDLVEGTGPDRRPYTRVPKYLDFDATSDGIEQVDYFGQVLLSLLADGNAFVATPRDRLGVPRELWPLDPLRVHVERYKGRKIFRADGVPGTFGPDEIMHIKGMTMPGQLRGISPIRACREVIGGAAEAQAFGASFFRNNAVPPAVIEIPGETQEENQERAKRIATTWRETNGGTANAGKVGVLIGGASLKTVAVTPEDAQWLDTRRFGIQEVARLYGVPPHLLADASNSTSWGSGLAEQNLAFGQFTLRSWITRVESAHRRLLRSHGVPAVLKLNLDAMLRASAKDRFETYTLGTAAGIYTVNEVRALEDLPPVEWGDVPFLPQSIELPAAA